MLTQVGDNKNFIKGFAGVNVIGTLDDKKVIYPLKDLSLEIKSLDIKFRYRYFQDIKGELTIPKGFTPEQVQVLAQASGNKAQRAEQLFPWQVSTTGR